jgi:hypothetical protein
MAHLIGDDDGVGFGVKGTCNPPHHGKGIEGVSRTGDGVFGQTNANHAAGVRGVHTGHLSAIGVMGELQKGITAVMGLQGGGTGVGGDAVDGSGVWGDSTNGPGVAGTSSTAEGVVGEGATFGVRGLSTNGAGVSGESGLGEGVRGSSHAKHGGVVGVNDGEIGGTGVFGVSRTGEGVHGETNSVSFVAGVAGIALNREGVAPGVLGQSNGKGPGVVGRATTDAGVIGFRGDPRLQETTVANDAGKAGVFGASDIGAGVLGYARDSDSPAVFAFGYLQAIALGNPLAGLFDGDVRVNGDICLPGADCAEHFDTADAEQIEAGSVVVIDQEGALRQSQQAYDRKVAGVVSGAGEYRPGIVLDKQQSQSDRVPVALVGKVYCKVDAQYSPIEVGDLLTSSPTPGHAMKAEDPLKAFGAVIGKALGNLSAGRGLLPILVCLQ